MDSPEQSSSEKSSVQPTKSSNSSLLRTISIGLGIIGIGFLIGIGGFMLITEEDNIRRDLSRELNPNNNKTFALQISKVVGKYARGVASTPTSGHGWIAMKESDKWRTIRTNTNNSIYNNCSIVNAYKIPKEIYESCVDN